MNQKVLSILILAEMLTTSPTGLAQSCNSNIRATTPVSRFVIDAKKGTVLDKKTGLMWKQCAEGLIGTGCTDGLESYVYWDKALSLGNNSKFAGYRDWRLPNVKELASLVERKCSSPSINLAVFPNTPSDDFWSSSPTATYDGASRTISFDTGAGDYFGGWRNDSYNAVRLVRGGQ